MAIGTVETQQPSANDFTTVEDLGSHIQRIAALLHAAMNTGQGEEEEEEGWLVSIAHDEALVAKRRYIEWANRGAEGEHHG